MSDPSTPKVQELAAAFDAVRETLMALAPDSNARNHALTAVGTAERRAVRALFAEERKP